MSEHRAYLQASLAGHKLHFELAGASIRVKVMVRSSLKLRSSYQL